MARTVRLAQSLDHRATAELAAELAADAELVVDATDVTFVGGLAAQLLLAARQGRPQRVAVIGSTGFAEGLRRLGIDPDLFPAELS